MTTRKSSTYRYVRCFYNMLISTYRYKMGDTFLSLPLPEVQELLSSSTEQIEESISAVETKLSGVREEMEGLKIELYARFGKSINLET